MFRRRMWALVVLSSLLALIVSMPMGVSAATTIKFWTHAHEPELVYSFVREFEKQNPSIKIQFEQVPSAEYFDKLIVALATGVGPDVFRLPDWFFELFHSKGLLAPVDPAAFGVTSHAEVEGLFTPGGLSGFKSADGVLYGGGISEVNVWSLLYNKRMFREAGIPLLSESKPLTWSEFNEIAKRLTKRTPAGALQIAGYRTLCNVGSTTYYLEWFEPLLRGCGGRWFNDKGMSALTYPEAIRAMDLWRDMVAKHKVDDPHYALSFIEDFPQGRAASQLLGPFYVPIVNAINPDFELGVAPQPIVDGGPRVTHMYAWSYVTSAKAPKARQAAAWTFAAWMTTARNEQWWDKLGFLQPTRRWLDVFPYDKYPYMRVFIDDMQYGEPLVKTPHISELGQIMKDAIERCTLNGMSSIESLTIASDQLNRVLRAK